MNFSSLVGILKSLIIRLHRAINGYLIVPHRLSACNEYKIK